MGPRTNPFWFLAQLFQSYGPPSAHIVYTGCHLKSRNPSYTGLPRNQSGDIFYTLPKEHNPSKNPGAKIFIKVIFKLCGPFTNLHMPSHHLPLICHPNIIILHGYAAQFWKTNQWHGRFAMMGDYCGSHSYLIERYGVFLFTKPVDPSSAFFSYLNHTNPAFVDTSPQPSCTLYFCYPPTHPLMDEILASMWNSLSLSESETITLNIDEVKLSAP